MIGTPGPVTLRAPQTARLLGLLLLLANCILLAAFDVPFERVLRHETFDAYQRWFPRERAANPVLVVEIDERSLREIGPWPWPRTRFAQLVERLAAAGPAVIAVDALFVGPDRYSPASLKRLLALPPAAEAALAQHLPDSDAGFARALAAVPVVLGAAGVNEGESAPEKTPPLRQYGPDPRPFVPHYEGLLASLPALRGAASGEALLNGEPERGVFRRVPTLATVGDGVLLPGLALESLRLAGGGDALLVDATADGLRRVGVAGIALPVDRDGGWWIHFSPRGERPTVSAAEVLAGTVDAAEIAGRMVLVGYTALGLQDIVTTPIGRMPGVEVHAEAIENAQAGRLLSRPRWVEWLELGGMSLLSAAAIAGASLLGPGRALALVTLGALAWTTGALALFFDRGLLVDAVNPLAGVGMVLIGVFGSTLAEVQGQRRQLREQLAQSRDAQLRMQGELDTARRIQTGMLPRPDDLAGTPGLELAAFSEPATTVGGDFYDFFLITPRRLFFVIGDVSGKGLPSALLMALAKAQIKSAALRTNGDPGAALSAANDAIAQDNPEYLFVTVVAACLDLDSGALAYANAGHDSPLFVGEGPVDAAPRADGPPLCTLEGFAYGTFQLELPRGTALCLYTDGISEAQDAQGRLYGRDRLLACLAERGAVLCAADLIARLRRDVAAHAADAEPADDMTLLVVARI